MKKIILSLLVVFMLLSILVVAQDLKFEFNPEPGNLYVASGDYLSYQLKVSSNYPIISYHVDSDFFSISEKAILSSNSALNEGDFFSLNVSVTNNNSQTISTQVNVTCTSQSSQDSGAWLSNKADLASTSHNAVVDSSSLDLSDSLDVNIRPDSLRVDSDGKLYFFLNSTVFVYDPDLSLDFSIPITDSKLNPLTVRDLVLTQDFFIVSTDNFLLLYSKDGTLIKRGFVAFNTMSPLKVLNNKLYFFKPDFKGDYLVSYDIFSFKKSSSKAFKGVSSQLVFNSDSVFISDFINSVSSFDLSLHENWHTSLSIPDKSSINDLLFVDSSNVLLVVAGSSLYILDPSSGTILDSQKFGSDIFNLVLLSDSLIAFQEGDNEITIFDLNSKSTVCMYSSSKRISSPLSSSSNDLIFGTSDAYDLVDFSCSLKDSFNTLNSAKFNFQPIITSDNVYLYSSSSLEKYVPQVIVVPEEKSSKDLKFSVSVVPGCAGGDTRFVLYDENSDPVSGANIHLLSDIGSFNVESNEEGMGSIFLPKSHYVLDVSASGYETALGEFDVVTCSAKGDVESAQEIEDIISSFSSTDSASGSSVSIPGSAMDLSANEFPTFASKPSDAEQEEIKTSTSKILSDQKENVFMFKSAKAFSLFMLLLVVLLIVIGIYVKFKVSAYRNSDHLVKDVEKSIKQDINHVEKDVVNDVKSAKDFIKGKSKN